MYLKNIVSHTHQGRRDYQEDSYVHGDTYLLVSDGVGGLAKGDIASGIVKTVWQEALEQKKIALSELDKNVQSMVQETINSLNAYASDHTENMGMGATLACAAIIDGKMVCIHVGDSRIYHLDKNGEIKWRSTDHSLVQELVTGGIITEEEAATHPRRNVITRVLQAKEGHETKAAVHVLDHIVTGDLLMVCSDGINESWSDAGISSVMVGHQDVSGILEVIGAHSAANSGDNNTAVMAEIVMEEDEQIITVSAGTLLTEEKQEEEQDNEEQPEEKKQENSDPNALVEEPTQNKDDETQADTLSTEKRMKINPIWIRWVVVGIMFIVLYIMMERSCTPKTRVSENKKEIGAVQSSNESVPLGKNKNIVPTSSIKSDKDVSNKSDEKTEQKTSVTQDGLVVIEDKINEDTLYHRFKRSRKLKDANMYLEQYPKGKYSGEINKALSDHYSRTKKDTSKQK